ncbi:hypothetical protein EJ110_NYTH58295 [Nymphaea thermarum]|nr:hypothetical protein EJ110_NYTH58295 [Nymphaea thermarum]
MNLPGGVYQEGTLAGRAILSTRPLFLAFLAFNVVAFALFLRHRCDTIQLGGLHQVDCSQDTLGCIDRMHIDGLSGRCLDDIRLRNWDGATT